MIGKNHGTRWLDREPPSAGDPDLSQKILDYLAYLKERINFALHNITKNGYIGHLDSTTVAFSNGLRFSRGRITKAPDSSSGTAVGDWYKYTVTYSLADSLWPRASTRPVVTGDVWVNGESYPASFRITGSAGAWENLVATFYIPDSTVTGNAQVEYIASYTIQEDVSNAN